MAIDLLLVDALTLPPPAPQSTPPPVNQAAVDAKPLLVALAGVLQAVDPLGSTAQAVADWLRKWG